jgi:hypothetical protein
VFRAETGQSPAKTIENLCIEARFLLDQGRLLVEEIARATGFAIASGCAGASCAASDERRKAYFAPACRYSSRPVRGRSLIELSIRLYVGHKERIQKHRTLDDRRRKALQAERLSVNYFTISA